MTTIELYRKVLGRKATDEKVVETLHKDAIEMRENIRYIYHLISTGKPAFGKSHDWNAARSAMSMHIDNFDKAFQEFYDNPNIKTATTFSDAISDIGPSMDMAKNAMFQSKCQEHWLEVKDEIMRKYGRTKEN